MRTKPGFPITAVMLFCSVLFLLTGCGKTNTLELSGTIESTQIDASAEAAGKIIKLVKDEGEKVKQGDVLAVIDSGTQELVVRQQEAAVKLKQVKLDELNSFSSPGQFAVKAAEADLEQARIMLEQARLAMSKCQIKAPVDGTLVSLNVNLGDMVNTGANTATISDLDNLWLRVFIQQKYLKYISLNQKLNLKATALEGRTITGKVIYIANEAEFTPKNVETNEAKENTVFRVKIKINEKIPELKPGMTVDAIIPLGVQE